MNTSGAKIRPAAADPAGSGGGGSTETDATKATSQDSSLAEDTMVTVTLLSEAGQPLW